MSGLSGLIPETSSGGFTFKRLTRDNQSRKRRFQDDIWDETRIKPRTQVLTLDAKKQRFNLEAYKEIEAIGHLTTDPNILSNIFMFLSYKDVQSCVRVSLLWHAVGQVEIRRRSDYWPCLRLASSPHEFPDKDLQLLSHIEGKLQRQKDLLIREIMEGFQAVLTFGTENYEDGFNETEDSELPQKSIVFMYCLSHELVITKPDFTQTGPSAKLIKNPSVFQSVCIPQVPNLRIKGFFIPACSVRSEYDDITLARELESMWTNADSSMEFESLIEMSQSSFKGLLLLQFGTNEFTDLLVIETINESNEPNKVQIGGGQFNSLGCNYAEGTITPMCVGWKIYGDDSVKVESLRLTLNTACDINDIAWCFSDLEKKYGNRRGFAIMLTKTTQEGDKAFQSQGLKINRKDVSEIISSMFRARFPKFPLVGLGTSGYLIHKGETQASKSHFKYPPDEELKAPDEVVCVFFFVAY